MLRGRSANKRSCSAPGEGGAGEGLIESSRGRLPEPAGKLFPPLRPRLWDSSCSQGQQLLLPTLGVCSLPQRMGGVRPAFGKKDQRAAGKRPEQILAEGEPGLQRAGSNGPLPHGVPEFSDLTPASSSSTYRSQGLPGPGPDLAPTPSLQLPRKGPVAAARRPGGEGGEGAVS